MRISRRTTLSILVAAAAAALSPTSANAQFIASDGGITDWTDPGIIVPLPEDNLGYLGRAAARQFIWSDLGGDEVNGPNGNFDIRQFRVTSGHDDLCFLVEFADVGTSFGDGAPMVQLALDFDQVADSGTKSFADTETTDLPTDAAWEYLIATDFGPEAAEQTTFLTVHNPFGGSSDSGSSHLIAESNILEAC
ncbi:MAG: hypothetical protein KC561_17680, partial [Myxococcales bacterium]|nr:hypothetical protein [Myxococcales bacterium]